MTINRARAVGRTSGGDAMSAFEIIIVTLTFVGLMIAIADKFSTRK
jgi:hypothetical protein